MAARGVQLGCPLSPRMLQSCHDDAAKFVHLLVSPGGSSLAQEDFIPFLQVRRPLLAGAPVSTPRRRAGSPKLAPRSPPNPRERQGGADSSTPEPAERGARQGLAPSGPGRP